MLAMDVPVAVMSGLVLAEGGKHLLKSGDKEKKRFMNVIVLMYAAIFIAPAPIYYMCGWPAWEVNYLWRWVDHIKGYPLRAGFIAYALLACVVIPTYLGYELGNFLIKKGKELWVRIGYIVMLILVGIIILLLRDITFNIYADFVKYDAGDSFSFWTHPFFTGWFLSALYFWGSLVLFYLWLRKQK